MAAPVSRRRYTDEDLRGPIASLAIEGLTVTEEDIHEVLAVLNGEISEDAYYQSLIARFVPSRS